MKFEEKLVTLRKERKLSQEQLAEKLGVSRQAVSRWESGETTPDMMNILGLCDIFEVSADYLIREDEQVTQSAPAQASTAPAAPKYGNLFILISAACFQIGLVASICSSCFSNNSLQSVLSFLGAGVCGGLSTYQFVRYGRSCR